MRAEDFCLADEAACMLLGKIIFIESLAEVTLLHLDSNKSEEFWVVKLPDVINKQKGEVIFFKTDPQKTHLFNKEVSH